MGEHSACGIQHSADLGQVKKVAGHGYYRGNSYTYDILIRTDRD
jgi:hypothetical protein